MTVAKRQNDTRENRVSVSAERSTLMPMMVSRANAGKRGYYYTDARMKRGRGKRMEPNLGLGCGGGAEGGATDAHN